MHNGEVLRFTETDTGDMRDIPPDAPMGAWRARSEAELKKNEKTGRPQITIEWNLLANLTSDSDLDPFIEKKASVRAWVGFPDVTDDLNIQRMKKLEFRGLCHAIGIEVPVLGKIKTGDQLAELMQALDGAEAVIFTTVDTRGDEPRTRVVYSCPPSVRAILSEEGEAALAELSERSATEGDEGEEEEEEEEAPAPAPIAAKGKGGTVSKITQKASAPAATTTAKKKSSRR